MRCIIAGSRGIKNLAVVEAAIAASGWGAEIAEVVSGCALGVDRLGEDWAFLHGVPVIPFPADWRKDGKAAGIVRNKKMASVSEALIAVWDGESRGTANMIQEAQRRGLKVYVHRIPA